MGPETGSLQTGRSANPTCRNSTAFQPRLMRAAKRRRCRRLVASAAAARAAISRVQQPVKPLSGHIDFRQMLLDPASKCQDRFRHRMGQLGQPALYLWRAGREDRPGHHAVSLETAQRTGQHLLRDAARAPSDVVEAARAVPQQHDNEHAPLLIDAREDLADLAAVLVERVVHSLRSSRCALVSPIGVLEI